MTIINVAQVLPYNSINTWNMEAFDSLLENRYLGLSKYS